jgi:hypothetical protein
LERAAESGDYEAQVAYAAERYRAGRLERGQIGRYHLLNPRGHQAYDPERGRIVNLVQLGLSPEALERWRAEMTFLADVEGARVTGPEVVDPVEGRWVWFALDSGPGQSWADREQPWQRAPLPQRLAWVRAVGRVVSLVQERGGIFGGLHDLGCGEPLHIARGLPVEDRPDLEADGAVIGNLFFWGSEPASGLRATALGDLEVLGLLLYLALTGRHPLSTDETPGGLIKNLAERRFDSPRVRDPSIAPALEWVCLRALRRGLAPHYETARAFLADLERAESGKPLDDASRWERVRSWWRGE